MAVTEIALLHLVQGVRIDDAHVRSKLAHARAVMQEYTGRTFYYLQQVEDPAYIYIIGEWDSLDQHMEKFIPSADNQATLESLKGLLSVDWLLHIDSAHADLPLPPPGTNMATASVYGLVRHFVKGGQRKNFQETYDNEKHHLQAFVTEGKIGEAGAWTETGTRMNYGKIREHIEGAEIKHARILDI